MKKILNYLTYAFLQRIFYICVPCKKDNPKSVNVIYKPDAIGDFILASGVIRGLLKRKPGAWVLICSPEAEDIARHLYPKLDIIVMQGSNNPGSVNAIAKIRSLRGFCQNHNIETLVCLRHSLTGMDHVLLNWLHPVRSSGNIHTHIPAETPGPYHRYTFTHQPSHPVNRDALPLEVHIHLAVVNRLLNRPLTESECLPFLDLPPTTSSHPPELAIFPVTRSRLRNYPLLRLADAVNCFLDLHREYRVHIYGTQADEPELNEFRSLIHTHQTVAIEYPASILAAAHRIQESSLILCMESAPAHIATTLDIPMVCILGGGHFNYFAPWGNDERQIWLYTVLPCYTCNWKCIYDNPICIYEIPSSKITAKLVHLANMHKTK